MTNLIQHVIMTLKKQYWIYINYLYDIFLLLNEKDKNLKFIWALSLPGKVAPTTTAEFIKDTVYNIIKEVYKK